jgi:polar amino acid transport system substrate-binding protein
MLTTTSRRSVLMLGLLSASFLLSESAISSESTLERAQREGVLRVGFANEAPWGYLKPDGTLTGEAPEILRVLAKRMRIEKIEGVLVEFGSLIPGLQAKRFDVIATALFIRPKRCAQVAFANPTVAVGNGFLVRRGNPKGLHSFEDVAKNTDANLSILAGSVDLQYAKDAGIPVERVVQLPDGASQLEALRSGRVDAISQNGPAIQIYADRTRDEFERALPFHNTEKTTGYGAFAVRLEDTDLLEALNQALKDFIGSEVHLALVKPFGVTSEELPAPGKTAAVLCKSGQ